MNIIQNLISRNFEISENPENPKFKFQNSKSIIRIQNQNSKQKTRIQNLEYLLEI